MPMNMREKVLKEKERKKMEEQERIKEQLRKIRQENMKHKSDAVEKEKEQYKASQGMQSCFGNIDSPSKKSAKSRSVIE
jgi:hypothetical protein